MAFKMDFVFLFPFIVKMRFFPHEMNAF